MLDNVAAAHLTHVRFHLDWNQAQCNHDEPIENCDRNVWNEWYLQRIDAVLAMLAARHIEPVVVLSGVAAILALGVETDEYDPLPSVDVLDKANAVTVNPGNIPAGAGITQDDSQPFPLLGWLEAKWVDPGALEQ